MSIKKFLLFVLIAQISTITRPQTSQYGSVSADQNRPAKQVQREMDPGLTLLLSVIGVPLGGFITFLGIFSSGGAFVVCHENYPYSRTDKAVFGAFGLTGLAAGLGITYLGTKMTWFYLKRGGKVLFHKD